MPEIQYGIRITADGKVAVTTAAEVESAYRKIGETADQVTPKLGKTREGLESISQSVKLLAGLNIGTLGINLALDLVNSLRDSLLNLPKLGREFAASMETNQLGMAAILSSMTQINGKALDFSRSMAISSDMMRKLNQDAIRTAASTEELVNAYRALLGPGMAANMSLEQIRQLTVTGVNAVKAMGLPAQQVVQELRDLVQGGITAASSTLATALGLRDEDIAKAKSSAEGLYSFLMKRLDGFTQAADLYSETISGVASTLQEKLTLSAAAGFSSLTQYGKESMQRLTEIVSSQEFVNALKAVSDGLVFLGFMLKAAFDVGKQFLLAGSLVAGGYAIAASVAAINTATLATTGSMALLSKEMLLFVTGAAFQRLEALSAGTKGGLVGLALWGGWEIGEFLNRNTQIQKSVQGILDPIFRFFDRSDSGMLDKLSQKLAELKSGAKLASAIAFDQPMSEKERLATIVETERKIAEIRGRLMAGMPQTSGTKAAGEDPALKVGILDQAYQKLIGTTKTVTSVEKEYNDQLTASRKQYMALLSAKNEAGATQKELMTLAKTQDQYEAAIAKKRADELHNLGKESRAVMVARIDDTLKLREIDLKAVADHVKALNAMGQLSDRQAVIEQERVNEEKISAEILAQRQKLTGASKEEAAKLNAAINELNAQRVTSYQKMADDLLVIEDKEGREETGRRAEEAKRRGNIEMAYTLDFIAKNSVALRKAYADNNQERVAQIQATFDAGLNQTKFDSSKQQFEALFSELKAQLEGVRQEAERDGGWLSALRASATADQIRSKLIPQIKAVQDQMAGFAGTSPVNQKVVTDAVAQVTKIADEVDPVWKSAVSKVDSTFHAGFSRMLERAKGGWKGLCDSLSNTFKTTVADGIYQFFARPFFLQMVAGVAGMVGANGMANAAASAAGSATGYSMLGGATSLTGMANTFSTSGIGQSLGLSSAIGGGNGAILSAGGDMLASIAGAAPYIAAALAIANAVGLFGKGGGPQQGQYGITDSSGYHPEFTMSGGDTLGNQALAAGPWNEIRSLLATTNRTLDGLSINQGYKLDPQGNSPGRAYRYISVGGQQISVNENTGLGNADAAGAAKLLGTLNSDELMKVIQAIGDPALSAAAEKLSANFDDLSKALPAYLTAQAGQKTLLGTFKTDAEKLADAQKTLRDAGLPDTANELRDFASAIDPTTQAGQDMVAQMMGLKSSFDVVTSSVATTAAENKRLQEALDSGMMTATQAYEKQRAAIADSNKALSDQENALRSLGITGASLSSILTEGMTGRIKADDVGGMFADAVIGGIYNAMASGFSDQISQIVMEMVVRPVTLAMAAGTSAADAIANISIDEMVSKVNAVAEAMSTVFNNTEFVAAMGNLKTSLEGIGSSIAGITQYTPYVSNQKEEDQAAKDAKARADAIASERKGIRDQLDALTMNAEQLFEKERDALDATNRTLFAELHAAQVAKDVADERKGLQDQLDVLTMTDAQLLEKQRSALHAVNDELFDQVQAAQAAKTALDEWHQAQDRARDDAKKALDDANSKAKTAQSDLLSAYQKEVELKQKLVTTWRDYSKEITKFSQSLLTGDLSPLSTTGKYEKLSSQVSDLLARAQLGDTSAIDQLQAVETQFLTASQGMYGNTERFYQDVTRVLDANTAVASVADRQANIAQDSLTTLRDQVSALTTINDSVLTVADAERATANAIQEFIRAQSAVTTAQNHFDATPASAATTAANLRSQVLGLYANDSTARLYNPDGPDAAGLAYWTSQIAQHGFDQVQGDFTRTVTQYAQDQMAHRLPGFAKGGVAANGFYIAGEGGRPEIIESVGATRIYPAEQTSAIMDRLQHGGDSKEVAAELRNQTRAIERQNQLLGEVLDALEDVRSQGTEDTRGLKQYLGPILAKLAA